MADQPRTYLESDRFSGRIGRTWEASEAAFPMPPSAPDGAPNVLYIIIDDIGFGWIEPFGGLIRTPNIDRLAGNGFEVHELHHDGAVFADVGCAGDRTQPSLGGHGGDHRDAKGFPGYNGRQPQSKAGIPAMLHQHGYTSFCVGKWHNTPSEETSLAGPYDRWPDGSVFGFDRFYGLLGGDCDQWHPKLFMDREPVDTVGDPAQGYHLSQDLVDQTIRWVSTHSSLARDKPWLTRLAFGAMHAPHTSGPSTRTGTSDVRSGLGSLPRTDAGPPEGARRPARAHPVDQDA